MTDSKLFEIDELQMYFCEPYKINNKITVYCPTIGDIIRFGEKKYYSMIYTLTAIPSDMKSTLADGGYDYMDLDDFELFTMLAKNFSQEETKLVLGDLDLSAFKVFINRENGQLVLRNVEQDIVIDKIIYMQIVNYLRKMHQITPKVEKAANKTTKKILIELDRNRLKSQQNQPYKSILKELVSAMMRYPGFKYKANELKECGIYEFMDTVKGSQIYISSTALLQGCYSGMVDTKKISKNEFNWMRSP